MGGRRSDLLGRLADASEEALQRLMSAPGAERVMGGTIGVLDTMRQQLDAITNRVRGMDALERRLDELERRVDLLAATSGASTSELPAAGETTATATDEP